ncbi:MAG: MFS transporter, partial [Myxococcota bacterium]
FFILNMIALGLGPTFVGLLSASLTEQWGSAMALRIALSTVVVATLVAIAFFVRLTRTVESDWTKATQG